MKIQILLFLIALFFCTPFSGISQTYNANYAAVVNQTSQTNITNNLTAFENLEVKTSWNCRF
jgi:hypothetical protein